MASATKRSVSKESSGIDPEVKALSRQALAILKAKSPKPDRSERRAIESAMDGSFGEPVHVLRNFVANLPQHESFEIVFVYMDAVKVGLPRDVLITSDHIVIRDALQQHYLALQSEGKISVHDETVDAAFKDIWTYAMHNIEDAHLIATMYVERDIQTLREMLELLPVLKNSGHRALTEGVL